MSWRLYWFFPTPVHREGKRRLRDYTARVKIASAPVFPTASFCRRGQFPICLCVRLCVRPERRPTNLGAKAVLVAPSSNAATQTFSTGPKHAIAGTRARAVTMATDRPPSLLNHSRRLASCRAPRCACGNKSVHDRVYLRTALPKVRAIHNRKRDGPTRFVGL